MKRASLGAQRVKSLFDLMRPHATTLFQGIELVFCLADHLATLVASRVAGDFGTLEEDTHLRRLLNLVRLYGREEVLAAIAQAIEYQTYDAAYVETILLQQRRQRELPSPTPVRPQRQELIEEVDLDEPDPEDYERFCRDHDDDDDDQEKPGE